MWSRRLRHLHSWATAAAWYAPGGVRTSLGWAAPSEGTAIDERCVPLDVLICTKNRPDLVHRCLLGILSGTALPASILVVDQSTDDATLVAVGAIAGDAAVPLHVLTTRTTGMAAGQNEGFGQLSASVILVTDDDCVPSANWVATAWRCFADDPDLGLLGGRVLPLGDDEPGRLAVSTRTSTRPAVLDGSTPPWNVGSGNNFAVSKKAITLVGGNDERLGPGARFRGGADMDLFRRLLRSGVRGRYEPDLLVHHERATPAERLGRRIPYGYGTGVALSLWWRQGDRAAAGLLRRWLALRLRLVRRSIRGRRRSGVWEEVLVLTGTGRGLLRGLVLRDPGPVQTAGRS